MRLLRCVCSLSRRMVEIDSRHIVALAAYSEDETLVYTPTYTFHIQGSLERIKEQLRFTPTTKKRWWQL